MRTCSNCRFYSEIESCFRFPNPIAKLRHDWCGEHKNILASKEILSTELAALNTSVYIRNVLAHLKVFTIDDLLCLGRHGIVSRGRLDKQAIAEAEELLNKLEIFWDSI